MSLVERTQKLQVPKGTGVGGFLAALKGILKLRYLQQVRIERDGLVTYKYLAEEDDALPPGIDLTSVTPYQVLRNTRMSEVPMEGTPFERLYWAFGGIDLDEALPICWLVGSPSNFGVWFGRDLSDTLYGLPVVRDSELPEDSLFLLGAKESGSVMTDATVSHKVLMV